MLLVMIYLAFISLGLPDSLLGAAWPTLRVDLAAPLALAGAISMVSSGGTIVSSLMSARLIDRFGTGKVTAVSVAMTAVALLGYALAPAPWLLFVAAVPLGLGAGSVDAALNNYVALHYEARHMSWLHCFWGLGATIGPMILSGCISAGAGWRSGYLCIVALQGMLAIALALTQPLWRKHAEPLHQAASGKPVRTMTNMQVLRLPSMKTVLATFLCYCAVEATMMLWTSSYAEHRGATPEEAAFAASLLFMGITIGRGLNGFLAMKYSSKALIRLGTALMLLGIAAMLLPLGYAGCLVGVALFGLGCAPIYPCTIHETPRRFGAEASQAATGMQMSSAYLGSTLTPPLLGLISGRVGMGILPLFALGITLCMLLGNEIINRRMQALEK